MNQKCCGCGLDFEPVEVILPAADQSGLESQQLCKSRQICMKCKSVRLELMGHKTCCIKTRSGNTYGPFSLGGTPGTMEGVV